MSLTELFFSFRGRVRRSDYWYAALVVLSVFVVWFIALERMFGRGATWILYAPLYWSMLAISMKRYHDIGRSGWWLLLLLIPIIGPLWVVWSLGFRKGHVTENRYGAVPYREQLDYLTVPSSAGTTIINDVTELNPVRVREVVRPETVEHVQAAIRDSSGPISVGGGRFSMGGQTASFDSLHLDMRGLNQIVEFSPSERWIRVQTGIRWCDIQRFLDPHDLSVKIMQTYANPTVGGSLSVNAHGRYMGQGPLILSVRSITMILADGTKQTASPTENSQLFHGAIGGYGGLGIIVEAVLELAENRRVAGMPVKLATTDYLRHFRENVRGNGHAIFHNADLYPPHYSQMRSMTWIETDKPVTQTNRLMNLRSSFPLERYFFWAISETPTGKWRREFLIDPLLYFRQRVHWRNYEAGYDVAELEPASRAHTTYVLQEYFVPINRFDEFVPRLAEILRRHQVNVLNISVRHALADPGSLLAWAREEVLAFVLYYKQGVAVQDRGRVGVWTRELIDAVLSVGGAYYLPYQTHATAEQFHRAYPRAEECFRLKKQFDPDFRFRNALWDKYYAPTLAPSAVVKAEASEFRQVFANAPGSDAIYRFLQNVFHLYPEDKFHHIIQDACARFRTDQEIYEHIQASLPSIKTPLSDLTYALPALTKQKREMSRQTLALLGDRQSFKGYVEIGSVGRYISDLRKHVVFTGPVWIVNDIAPGNGPGDIMERGQLAKLGKFVLLDYQPLDSKGIAPSSIELLTCFIGLHHCPDELLDGFVKSIHRVLRPGGLFIIRDHDAGTPEFAVFCSLVHTIFNSGLKVPCATNAAEFKHFASADEWSRRIVERGFRDLGPRLLQENDPSDNTLMAFIKIETEAAR